MMGSYSAITVKELVINNIDEPQNNYADGKNPGERVRAYCTTPFTQFSRKYEL